MPRLSRYANITRHKFKGITFDSKREMKRYQELELLQRAGEIYDLTCQHRIKIIIGGVPVKFESGRIMEYWADFSYFDVRANRYIYEDVKMKSGHRTEVYKIKRALVKAMGINILETT